MDSEVITSVDNAFVKHCVKLRSSGKYRREKGELLLVGRKVVSEWQGESTLIQLEGGTGRQVTSHVMKKITGLDSPDGVAAIVPLPEWQLPAQLGRLLIVDGLQDPGNLGSLFRTAIAFGWDAIILAGESVDPYNEKVMRASRGAPLRFPHFQMEWTAIHELLEEHSLTKWVADLEGESLPESSEEGIALVLGSEGQGPSPAALEGAHCVTLEMAGDMESLNVAVAGGILMHHFGGKR